MNFDLFPELAIYGMILSHDAGPWPPVSHPTMRINSQYTYNHSVPTQPFWFSISVQYSINYMRHSTLYYKIGFVLDDFAQLYANVNILIVCNVG